MENIVSEIQVTFKRKTFGKVTESKAIYDFIKPAYENKMDMQEVFTVILLNNSLEIMGHYPISQGGINSTIVDTRIIFGLALKGLAVSIALVHNHPSGKLQPSEQDLSITKKIKEIGKLLDIKVIDHLIITSEGFYSFADEGIL